MSDSDSPLIMTEIRNKDFFSTTCQSFPQSVPERPEADMDLPVLCQWNAPLNVRSQKSS